jgi:phytoene dehydrogenase-like protein
MAQSPGTKAHELYRQLGLHNGLDYQPLETYLRLIDQKSGRFFDVAKDLDLLADKAEVLFPKDTRFTRRFFKQAQKFRNIDLEMDAAPELRNLKSSFKSVWGLGRAFKFMGPTYNQSMEDYVKELNSSWLRWILNHLFLPEAPVWFVMMLLGLLNSNQLFTCQQGSLGFTNALVKRFYDLDGEIRYKSPVEEIIIKDDRVKGVLLSNGEKIKADRVITACDGLSVFLGMLGGKYMNRGSFERHEKWPLFRPVVMVSLGLMADAADLLQFTALRPDYALKAGKIDDKCLMVRFTPNQVEAKESKKTVLTVLAETDWEYWAALKNDPKAYQKEKQTVCGEIIRLLERQWPKLLTSIDMTDVATPITTWRYTRNHRGAYEGFLPTPQAVRAQIPRTLPGLKGLVMAGQWVLPGGGVIPCLNSGRTAVKIILKELGKKFITV